MKQLSTLLSLVVPVALHAQCPFTPTISPGNAILCPTETVELTTEVYDSYQWYVNGNAVPGATEQTFIAYEFMEVTVEGTLDGCTEESAVVLVDQWVFLLPSVYHAGAEPLYTDGNGVPHHCLGDTVLLIFTYPLNVQWTDDGVDIPGANNDTLVVTQAGAYSASGANTTCPNYIQNLGLTIEIDFVIPTQPSIVLDDDELCATPAGVSYQWYLNDAPLAASTACITRAAEGSYVVDVTYASSCSVPSAPYLTTNVAENTSGEVTRLFPVPARDAVTVQWGSSAAAADWEVVDGIGRVIIRGSRSAGPSQVIDLTDVPQGRYWLRTGVSLPMVLAVVK